MSAFQPFLQYFAAGSGTASCQDYEEKEFVEGFSEETQIIDIDNFTLTVMYTQCPKCNILQSLG